MSKIAIKNAFVFDGEAISSPRTIVVDGAQISDESSEADVDLVIDGSGCTLMPGLIDCHVHIDTVEQLAACAGYGVTTVCDMACWPKEKYNKLHSAGGPTAWLGCSLPAFAEGSTHGKLMKFVGVGTDQAIHSAGDAARFVEERVKENVDYIKIIADSPGVEQDHLNKIQEETRKHGKKTIAHTAHYDAFSRGLRAGFDILTHTPMDKALDQDMTDRMINQGTVVVPTLTMMEVFSNSWIMWLIQGTMNFQNAVDSVTAMREAGVPILAGTDTNNNPGMGVERGKSLHHELELLVKAGLSPSDALRSATSLAAKYFQLNDRGRIGPGLRADLVLVEGNVTEDITATRRIKRVWSAGKEIGQAKDSARCLMM